MDNILIDSINRKLIPCILITNNIEKIKKVNYYKCVSYIEDIPNIYILSNIKHNNINKYILLNIIDYREGILIGKIRYDIGDINISSNFLEYNIFCKKLYKLNILKLNIKWLKVLYRESFIDDIICKYNLINRTKENIYSIDPKECYLYDDAISLSNRDNYQIISIYISNVSLWVKYFNLYDNLLKIYNENKEINNNKVINSLILDILPQNYFSLDKYKRHIAFTIDLYILNNKLVNIEYINSLIYVNNNYSYDENNLLLDINYNKILKITKKLNTVDKCLSKIKSSNDIVEYYMTLVNRKLTEFLQSLNDNIIDNIEEKKYLHMTTPIKNNKDILYLYLIQNEMNLI